MAATNGENGEKDKTINHAGFWKHGRFYGSYKPEKYVFPIDSEELNRLDLFHKFFSIAREERIYTYALKTLDRKPRILDLGTGTGIWAIELAEMHLRGRCEIMAVDLHHIQPALIPVGLTTARFDIEEPSWDSLYRDCDLVHMRMLFGSIQTELWPDMYRKAFDHLAPGIGYVEHVEIDWRPSWEDSEMPPNSALKEWTELFVAGMERFNRSVKIEPDETRHLIEEAGFVDFRQQVTKVYFNPWSQDRQEREIGRWFNLGFCHAVEAMSMMPLVEKLGMTADDVRDLCEKVKQEVCHLRFHPHCKLYVWTAKRAANKA